MAKASIKQDDLAGFLLRLNGETPRGRILIEAGMLEELLRGAVRKRLADNKSSDDLFGEGCTLGLTVLAKYAHALGLLGSAEFSAIQQFAKARNLIAHSWQVGFDDPELQKCADRIQLISVLGENLEPPHQRSFLRLDYLGLFLIEDLFNRFSAMKRADFRDGRFVSSIVVDPKTGERTRKVAPA